MCLLCSIVLLPEALSGYSGQTTWKMRRPLSFFYHHQLLNRRFYLIIKVFYLSHSRCELRYTCVRGILLCYLKEEGHLLSTSQEQGPKFLGGGRGGSGGLHAVSWGLEDGGRGAEAGTATLLAARRRKKGVRQKNKHL